MDLLSIVLSLWRHKVAVVLVIILTGAGMSYVFLVQPSQYETTATLLLVPPPRPPTSDEVSADPSLQGLKHDNPYTRSYDPGIVVTVVATFVGSDPSRARLVQAGADPRFEVAQTVRYGFSSPVVEIRSVGTTAARSQETAEMVIAAFKEQLIALQAAEGVDQRYQIGTRLVDPAGPGILQASGKLRGLLGVAGLGVLALFTVVSTADAIQRVRADRPAGAPETSSVAAKAKVSERASRQRRKSSGSDASVRRR